MAKTNINLSPKDIITLNYEIIEKLHRETTTSLGWGAHTDVLYSFLGIFTLGIYILDSNKDNKYKVGNDKIIRLKDSKQWLYSRKYIINHIHDFSYVYKREEIIELASLYNSIGNVIPIWPGGNELKGTSRCYDIPEIFFSKYKKMEDIYVSHYLNKTINEVALTRFILKSELYVESIETVLN